MKVLCVNSVGTDLELGKWYYSKNCRNEKFYIMGDIVYYKWRFKTLSDVRKEKLMKISGSSKLENKDYNEYR